MAKNGISKIKSLTDRIENPVTLIEGEKNLAKRELDDKRNPRTSLTYFTEFSEKVTGVKPVMLFDCDGVYKSCGGTPFLYVCNGYLGVKRYVETMDFIKISVSETPEIISFRPPFNLFKKDILAVYDFIKKNGNLIVDLANSEIGTLGFIRSVKKVSCKDTIHEDQILSTEVGLMCDIWIDNTLSFEKSQHNEPRIKFQPNQGVHETKNFVTLILKDMALDKNQVVTTKIDKRYYKDAVSFAEANKDNIIALYNGDKSKEDFLFDLVTFKDGKPISQPLWRVLDDEETYGCRRVQFGDGKINFIDNNDEIVYKNNNFDAAAPFTKNNDGVIHSLIQQNGQYFMLTQPDFKLYYVKADVPNK